MPSIFGEPPTASTTYSTSTVPAFSNCSVPLTRLPFSNGCLQADEHQVIGAGLELDGLARLDLDAVRQRPHLHHAAVHRHLVDFELLPAFALVPPISRSGSVPVLISFM